MCGLVAVQGECTEQTLQRMLDRLAHRGPDGQGIFHDDLAVGRDVWLGHTRLAIIDPHGGAQPIPDPDRPERRAMVCNGMIYNYRGLRRELGPEQFVTKSDSEVVLHAFGEYGPELADELDGMFAYVMSDRGRILAARDLIGIKPLYLGRRGQTSIFASEIKALLGEVDQIEVVPPGCLYDSARGDGQDAIQPYAQVPPPSQDSESLEVRIRQVRETVEQAVIKRLRSDVPLGCFLSGGLDSSIVAAIAKRHLPELHTFSVGLEGSVDLAAARFMSDYLGTIHHEHIIEPDEVRQALPEILRSMESYDRDLVRSAVPCWFVSRLAKDYVKVVLTGEGSDELFAGYSYHRDYGPTPALSRELHRSIRAMHSINLQRVDRITMAHALEARVPFLDRKLITLAMQIDPARKLRKLPDGRVVDKWILREAFAEMVPTEIVQRAKLQFDQGTGLSDLLARDEFFGSLSSVDPATLPTLPDGRKPVDAEEARYAEILAEVLGPDPELFRLVDRWIDHRVDEAQPDAPSADEPKLVGA